MATANEDAGGPLAEESHTAQKQIAVEAARKSESASAPSVWKDIVTNPFALAVVGGFITLMTTIVANRFTTSQTLQADLIKKFVESPSKDTVRENLGFLVEADLIPDYAKGIKKYLDDHPGGPQIGPTSAPSTSNFNGVQFTSLVPNGYFSSSPGDLRIRRTARANNPAGLVVAPWSTKRPGFVGSLSGELGSPMAVYRTPEHGIASWYALLERYGFVSGRRVQIEEFANRFSGGSADYAQHLKMLLPPPAMTDFDIGNDEEMLALAKAVFRYELGTPPPWHDDQILFGIRAERTQSLPP